MPPVLPYVLAGLYWATGDDRVQVVEAVLMIKSAVLILTGLLVVGVARTLQRTWLGVGLFIAFLVAEFTLCFEHTHDMWLQLLVINLAVWGMASLWNVPRRARTAVLWGGVGGAAALTNPVLGAAWGLMTLVRWRSRLLYVLISAGVSMAVVAPWCIRNAVVFGEFVPIKSNVAYELWQAQVVDDDGVLDNETFINHPSTPFSEEHRRYADVGEMEFVASVWPVWWRDVQEDQEDALVRLNRRFFAASLRKSDKPWATGGLFADSPYQQGGDVFERWLFPLPLVSILVILLIRKPPLEPLCAAVISMYALYLAPYILVSYYDRYAMPLLGVKALLVLYALDTLLVPVGRLAGRWRGKKAVSAG
jgi:hypothetical protein